MEEVEEEWRGYLTKVTHVATTTTTTTTTT
jgi:hypothetical protein